ncbi:hypothetical protein, partial [Burkholderia sp. Se-20378]|uniref:hypothetical protein n=1 Tax=Burkholderia sp. Se-20378 TaxID=2703899 RepID=UPI00197F944D
GVCYGVYFLGLTALVDLSRLVVFDVAVRDGMFVGVMMLVIWSAVSSVRGWVFSRVAMVQSLFRNWLLSVVFFFFFFFY